MSKLDLRDLSSDKARVKYACAKQAIAVSQNHPKTFILILASSPSFLTATIVFLSGPG